MQSLNRDLTRRVGEKTKITIGFRSAKLWNFLLIIKVCYLARLMFNSVSFLSWKYQICHAFIGFTLGWKCSYWKIYTFVLDFTLEWPSFTQKNHHVNFITWSWCHAPEIIVIHLPATSHIIISAFSTKAFTLIAWMFICLVVTSKNLFKENSHV